MISIDTSNPLLDSIKVDIAQILNQDDVLGASSLNDKQRIDILNKLVSYSSEIPHPASGNDTQSLTLRRWQILAYVAGVDLTVAKWFESHLDALSILFEINYEGAVEGIWAVWAAEGHSNPIRYENKVVSGTKAWCSGANIVNHALMTYKDEQDQSQLLMVDMQQSDIEIELDSWQAVGMQATDTATVTFGKVSASRVGAPNVYLDRVGFWHGAAGVAACWYGATTRLADYLKTASQRKPHHYKSMYLGQVSTVLAVTQHYFYHVSFLIDTQSNDNHELIIRQLRANTEQVARLVVDTVGQALGAVPFCLDAHFARLSADLPVFIRQSHGAFDLQRIGELTGESESKNTVSDSQDNLWQL